MNIKRKQAMRYMCLFFVFSFIYITACQLEVPIKEMSLAKSLITLATEVKAKQYAPEEIKKSNEHLFKSHEYIKTEDVKMAKEEAQKARASADEAIAKSLPPLTEELMAEAKKIYNEADLAFADKYAPDKFMETDENIKEADVMMLNKELYDAYLKLKETIQNGTYARDKALDNKPALQEKISEIREGTESIKSNGGSEFAPQEISAVFSKLEEAESSLAQTNLKYAYPKIFEAEEDLKIAILKTKMGFAAKKIETAENALKKAEGNELKKIFIEDINKASALIVTSKKLYDGKSYDESLQKSQEAIELLNSIWIAIEKKAEDMRIAKGKSKIEAPDDIVDAGKMKGKDIEKAAILTEYVVKYNPGKRDCLWRIAHYIYKDARLWPLIYIANRDKIKDPDLIFPGQKLSIPPIPKRKESKGQRKKEKAVIREEKTPSKIEDSIEKDAKETFKNQKDEKVDVDKETPDESNITEPSKIKKE